MKKRKFKRFQGYSPAEGDENPATKDWPTENVNRTIGKRDPMTLKPGSVDAGSTFEQPSLTDKEKNVSYDLETDFNREYPISHVNENFIESVRLSFIGEQNQEPPVFQETECLKKCPSCSFPVAINDNNRGCNRVICFRINCQTEFCRYCKKISDTNSRHMRCECQR